MRLAWNIVSNNVNEVWDQIMQGAPSATFFQTRAWADLFSKTFPIWKTDPVIIEFSDGNLMVLPILRHSLTGYRECMIPRVYGGFVFLRQPEEEHLRVMKRVPTWYTDITLVENPFESYMREQEGLVRWQLETSVVKLTPDFDSLWQQFRENHRRNFKSAVKQGVSISLATSRKDIDVYFHIYKDCLRRWGKSASRFYPRSLFRNMLDMPEFGKDIKMYLARKDGEAIGGIIMLYHGTQSIYWNGVSHSEHLSAHPAQLLLISAIKEACEKGYHWFDLGPSHRAQSLQHFKDGFAIQKLPYNVYSLNNSIKGIIFKRYRKFKENSLRRCPISTRILF